MPTRRLFLASSVVLWGLACGGRAEDRTPAYGLRWVYVAHNLLVDDRAEEVVGLIRRAGTAGYNGIVLADYKFNILSRMPRNYFRNVERVKQAAREAGLEIIPAVFPVGYSSGLLAHDPNLAEGLPVVDAPFVVKGREAHLARDPEMKVRNGGLEEAKEKAFAGYSFQDEPGKATVADRETVHGGRVSCRMRDVGKPGSPANARLIQRVSVRPHACYRLSCWVKTAELASPGSFSLKAIGARDGRQLTFLESGVERNQDWKLVDVVFNSLDETEVNLYVGLWGGTTGTLWVDDLGLEDLGLVNVLRREGCPLSVVSADGKTRYEEGRDFEPVSDPKLGDVPYAGLYSFAHEGPGLRLTAGSRIKDGERLRVGWYHPIITHGEQVTCCLSAPGVDALLLDQARRVEALLSPKTYLMSHDEIRVANWCRTCQDHHQTPG